MVGLPRFTVVLRPFELRLLLQELFHCTVHVRVVPGHDLLCGRFAFALLGHGGLLFLRGADAEGRGATRHGGPVLVLRVVVLEVTLVVVTHVPLGTCELSFLCGHGYTFGTPPRRLMCFLILSWK